MRVFIHNSSYNFANSYIVGPDGPGDALIIDPVGLDVPLLELIENHRYYVRTVLLTTVRQQTVHGVRTLKRVYDAEIYSGYPQVFEFSSRGVERRQTLDLPGVSVEAIPLQHYSRYSLVFRMCGIVFTGIMMSAGLIGERHAEAERLLLAQALRETLTPLPDETVVFPVLGPPSTLGAERRFNADLQAPRTSDFCERHQDSYA